VARDFARLADELGHESTVITFAKKVEPENERENGINIKRLRPFLRYGNGAFLPQLFFGLKKFDIVHLHYPFFGVAEPVFIAKFFLRQRFRLIVHYHMDTPNLSGIAKLLSIFSRVTERFLFKMADRITYASDDYIKQSKIAAFYEKNKNKFFLLPFGVDTDKFFPIENKNLDKQYILFVGGLDRAHYFKGVENLLLAVQNILSDNLRLKIVGKGDMVDEYKKIAINLQINNYVDFAGGANDDELVSYYQKASLLVLPSINGHEAFGMVLLEAMSSGIPVIASNLPGVRSVFTDGIEGFLVQPGDIQDLELKIKNIFADEDLRVRMGERARGLVLERYGFGVLRKRLEKIYS